MKTRGWQGGVCEVLLPPKFHKFTFIFEQFSVNGLSQCPGVYRNNFMGNFQTINTAQTLCAVIHLILRRKVKGRMTKRRL